MIYLGLDLSLTATGYCVLHSSFETGVIKTKKKGLVRLDYIRSKITECVGNCKPRMVVLEGYSFGSRVGQAFSIGELGGVVKRALWKMDQDVMIVPPTCLKKFVSGKGNTSKDIILMKVLKKYGVEFTDNNECDAFALAQMGRAFVEGTNIQYEQEALGKIQWLK